METMTQAFKRIYGAQEWKDLDVNKQSDMLGMFRGYAAERLQVRKQQGKDTSAQTVEDMVKEFLGHEYDTNNIIMSDSKKNFSQLSAKDANTTKRGNLYDIGKQLAKLKRERLGLPDANPSQGEIYEALVNLDTRQYTNLQGFSFDGFSQPRLDYVRKTFKWLYHREPDALETLKWYTRSLWKKEKMDGEAAENAQTPLNNTFDGFGND